MDDKFINFCKVGNLNGIINNINKINIHTNNDAGFTWACYHGHKNIVEYLINIHKTRQSRNQNYIKINIHVFNETGFRWACLNGHKHIVKYLINLHKIQPIYAKINIHAQNESGFTWACADGHLHIVKYLLSCGCHLDNYKCIIIL